MDTFQVSVIIPNYNKEKYLETCLSSVLAQSYVPREIIVVDDCSKDRSREIIRDFMEKDPRVKGVFLEQNGGVSNARNVGLRTAQSEYVTFLDSDDFYYNKDKLLHEMKTVKHYRGQNMDVAAYSAVVRVDEDGQVLDRPPLSRSRYLDGNIHLALIGEVKGGREPRDYCVKKALLEQVGAYCYPKNYFEDLDLLLRLSKEIPFSFSGAYGTAYRDTPGGLSKRNPQDLRRVVSSIRGTYYQALSPTGKATVFFQKYGWQLCVQINRGFSYLRRHLPHK